MDEVINKPEEQFQNVLNDLIDFDKSSEEKSALIEEVCRKTSKQITKPAASLNSSIYSSAASSSSSTSSASDASTNSTSSSSTSSTLSSPSQSNHSNGETKEFRIIEIIEDYDNLEMPKMEDLGKTARILEHISSERTITANDIGICATTSHSDRISTNFFNKTQHLTTSSLVPQTLAYKLTQLNQQANMMLHNIDITNDIVTNNPVSVSDNISTTNCWKTISGKRDKRRRKPTEQPVLSQHIPGHKGEQEVDWLVKFIESGQGVGCSINNSSTKKVNNTKNTKPQLKRQATQSIDLDRENQQRKPNSASTLSKSGASQSRPILSQIKPTQGSHLITMRTQSDQRKVQPKPNNILSPPNGQQSSSPERLTEQAKVSGPEPRVPHMKSSLCHSQAKNIKEESVVTFADHIRVNEDHDVGERYTFGFFEEQRYHTNNQVKSSKSTLKQSEAPINSNDSKTSHVGQKHKMKHQKTSLISQQIRYTCTDNIDANSFNYHQILEFISNSWQRTSKSQ